MWAMALISISVALRLSPVYTENMYQGFHTSLKVFEFFSPNFKALRALKVLENRTGA